MMQRSEDNHIGLLLMLWKAMGSNVPFFALASVLIVVIFVFHHAASAR